MSSKGSVLVFQRWKCMLSAQKRFVHAALLFFLSFMRQRSTHALFQKPILGFPRPKTGRSHG